MWELYFDIRWSDVVSYLFVSQVNPDKKYVDKMEKAVEIYEWIARRDDIRKDNSDRQKSALYGYIANSIAFYKHKLLEYKKPNDKTGELNTIQNWYREAVGSNPKGRYLQNYGVFIQRYGGYLALNKKEDPESLYYRALQAEKRDPKIYNLLGSFYLKQVDKEFGMDDRFADEKLLSELDVKKINEPVLKLACSYLKIALSVTPEFLDVHANLAKVYMYEGLLNQNNATYFREKAEAELNIADELLVSKHIFLFTKRNCLEAWGNTEEANKKNDEIKELLSDRLLKTDVTQAEELYKKKLGENINSDQT